MPRDPLTLASLSRLRVAEASLVPTIPELVHKIDIRHKQALSSKPEMKATFGRI